METDDHLPEPFTWYEFQIAGHHPSVIKNGLRQIGIIKEPNTPYILKVVQDDVRGICEEQLYIDIMKASEQGDTKQAFLCALRTLVPQFYGLQTIKIGKVLREYTFMKLEDIIYSYSQPCVMDVKIGRVTYDPLASAEKKEAELKKFPFQMECGFRILGYRNSTTNSTRDKEWGRTRTPSNIDDAFSEFLQGRKDSVEQLLKKFLEKLLVVEEYFANQTSLQFYASSLLFVYEGDTNRDEAVDLRMIDFSHVFRSEGIRDDNYLTGVKFIRAVFERLSSLKS